MVYRDDMGSEPYCGNCGYALVGLTESSKCPECGRPIVEVLTRNTPVVRGYRWRSKSRLWGLPLVDINFTPRHHPSGGRAVGIIAIGRIALGGLAIGTLSLGAVSIGIVGVGLVSLGVVCLGILSVLCINGAGLLAVGINAWGWFATAVNAGGYAAQGVNAVGVFIRCRSRPFSAASAEFFQRSGWYFGEAGSRVQSLIPVLWGVAILLLAAAAVAIPVLLRLRRQKWAREEAAAAR